MTTTILPHAIQGLSESPYIPRDLTATELITYLLSYSIAICKVQALQEYPSARLFSGWLSFWQIMKKGFFPERCEKYFCRESTHENNFVQVETQE